MQMREDSGGNSGGPPGPGGSVVALCFGNTRTRIGVIGAGEIREGRSIDNADRDEILAQARRLRGESDSAAFVIASVNRPLSGVVELELARDSDVFVIGRDLEIPIVHALQDASTVGQDRLLDALGAFSRLKEACVVVDAGTAVTIDFVDGEGVFQGGVIAPGLRTMLRSLHSAAPALPELAYEAPEASRGPFGKDTSEAMRLGVTNALVGLVRQTVEKFAEYYEAFPPVVATGGDAEILRDDPIVDRIVPDLQLIGVAEVCRVALEAEHSGGDSDEIG